MTSVSSQNARASGIGTSVSRSANRYLYSRPTSLADGRNAPTGGRRTTSSVSPTVTAIVRLDAPPLMTSCRSAPSTPTLSRSQALRAASSRSDMLRAQFPFEDLAAGVAGQLLVDDPHVCRHLEPGQPCGDVFAHLLFGDLDAVADTHHCTHLLAEAVVRNADDRGLGDVGMLVQRRFDFGGIDVLA